MRRLASAFLLIAACAKPHPPLSAVHDDLGRAVTVRQNVRRVVTLSPNLTEIVFAIGAGDKIVATDDYSDIPDAAKRLPKVGGMQPSLERIVSARPDLVLAPSSANYGALIAALASNNIPLYVVRTDRVDDIARVMEQLGAMLDAPRARIASRLLIDGLHLQGLHLQRHKRAKAPRILFAAWADPLYVAGHKTYVDDLYAITGAQNAVQVDGWPQYAIESVVASPPDILLHSSRLDVAPVFKNAPELLSRIRVVAIDENKYTRPGPHVVDAAADLNRIIDEWERSH